MRKILCYLTLICIGHGSFAQEKEKSELLTLKTNAEAYTFLEKGSEHSTNGALYLAMPAFSKSHHFVISMFALVEHDHDTSGWAEVTIGPSYVSKCFEAGVLVGLETGKDFWRFSPWLILRSKKEIFNLLAVYETGASGSGFRAEGYALVTNPKQKFKFSCGVVAHSPHIGPSFKIGYKKVYLFCAPQMISWNPDEKPVTLIGIGTDQ